MEISYHMGWKAVNTVSDDSQTVFLCSNYLSDFGLENMKA